MSDNNSTDEQCEINVTRMYALQPPNGDFSYFLCGPLLSAIVFGGLVSNALCLLVFFSTILRPRIYLYLIALTIWDILLLISSFLLYSLPVLLYGGVYIFGPYVPAYPLFYTFSNVAHSGSIWTVVVLAVERYFALCRPLRYIMWNTEMRAKTLLSTVAGLAVLYHVPNIFEIVFLYCIESTTKEIVVVMVSSKLRENAVYKGLYKILGGMMFFSVGPLLVLSTLTVRVSIAVKKNFTLQRKLSFVESTKLAKKMSTASGDTGYKNGGVDPKQRRSEEREEKRMDLMLIVVMIKFCLCHTLPVVLDLCETVMNGEQFRVPFFETMVDISNVLIVTNSSCNLIIYLIFGVKFRSSLKSFFAGRYHKNSQYSFGSVKSYCGSTDGQQRNSKREAKCVLEYSFNETQGNVL